MEDGEQHAALVRLGCSMAQGYLHARPMPMNEILMNRSVEQKADALEVAATG